MRDTSPLGFRASERAFAVIVWIVSSLTFLKGFRFPSLWCATHFTFNYSQGFVRRGLVGELARRIGGDDVYKYNVFLGLSFVIFGAVATLLCVGVQRVLREHPGNWAFRAALLVFCASPGTVFLVHLVGYFDFLGLLSLLALLWFGVRARGGFSVFYVLGGLGCVLPLIHEGLLVMFGPSALFVGVCQWLRALGDREPGARDWSLLAAHVMGSVLLVCAVSYAVSGTTALPTQQALQRFATQHADFKLRPDAFQVLSQSTRHNILVVVPGYWSWPFGRTLALRGQIAFVPGFLFLLYCGAREIWAARRAKTLRVALLLLFVAAAIAPEAMNVVGWDWPRWNSMALMSALICMLAYQLYFPSAKRARPSLSLLTLGVALTSIGLASTTMLFDNYQVQFFPFDQQFEFMNRVLDGNFRYRPAE